MRRGVMKERLFEYVAGFVAAHGYGPTTREIMEAVGLKSTSGVDYWMNKLEEEGRLVRERDERGRARVGRMTIREQQGIIGDVAGERHDRSLPAGYLQLQDDDLPADCSVQPLWDAYKKQVEEMGGWMDEFGRAHLEGVEYYRLWKPVRVEEEDTAYPCQDYLQEGE